MPYATLAALECRLNQAATVQQVAAATIAVGRSLMGCDGITFVLNDNGNCYYMDEDGISPLWKGLRFPADACISGWVMRNRQAVIIPDIVQDPRIPQDIYRRTFVKSMQMVPVGERGEAAIGAYWAEYHDPTDREILVLHALARLGAAALERLSASA